MRANFVLRVRLIFALFLILGALFSVRLYFVQIIYSEKYIEKGESQYVASTAVTDERGDIFFKDKDSRLVTAATQKSGWRLAIQPNEIEKSKEVNPDSIYNGVSSVLVDLDSERFFNSAAKTNDPYEDISFRLTDEEADNIRAMDFDGIVLSREKWRFYPAQERAAHVLGFVGYQGNEKVGRYGLERYFEDTLVRDKNILDTNFFAEIFSNVRAFVSSDDAGHEGELVTSIEPTVQKHLEDILSNVGEEWKAKKLGGIVMDPKTGEIFAIGAWPTFNPNEFNTEPEASIFVNPLIEGVYEMGSIMKPLTMAAAIDTGAVTAETTYYDAGFVMKSGVKISNYDGKGRGYVSMQEVLSQSLNTGASFVVDEMGHDVFENYVDIYGLGEETGIDLPNEVKGILGGLKSKSEVDYASASFGQGIAVTPIAMVRALSSIANGGELVQPHVVSEIQYGPGLSKKTWNKPEKRVLKKETSEEITRMLVKVVDDALLDGTVKQDRYSIAAKTGTAQIASPNGGYYDDRFLHSFFGYFPAHDARFMIFLFALEPRGVRYASQTLANPFMDLTKFLINYYDIPPDR
jgi:cell division protein FtsI/penicillin-binding protein 2